MERALRVLWILVCGWWAGTSLAEITIRGKVVGPEGRAMRGAVVSLEPLLSTYDRGALRLAGDRTKAQTEAKTTAEGHFELRAPGPGFWRVTVRARGFLPMTRSLIPLLYATDLPPLGLGKAQPLEVTVTDPGGKPLPGARVAVYEAPSSSRRVRFGNTDGWRPAARFGVAGEDGTVRLATGSRERLRVVASADGLPPADLELEGRRQTVRLSAGQPRPIVLVDDQDRPVADVLVLDSSRRLPLGRADSEGRWTAHQAGKEALTLSFTSAAGHRGNHSLMPAESPEAANKPQRMSLATPTAINGRVIEADSRRPIAGALVWSTFDTFSRTDRQGQYQLSVDLRGRMVLNAAAEGYAGGGSFGRIRPDDGARGPTIALAPAATLRGRVLDATGRAVRDAEIRAEVQQQAAIRFRLGRGTGGLARSDAQGRFEIAGLEAGHNYDLKGKKKGFTEASLEVTELTPFETREGVEIVLKAGLTVIGQVVSDADDSPIAGARVELVEAQGEGGIRRRFFMARQGMKEREPVVCDAQGQFRIEDLAPGRYDLKVRASSFSPTTVPGLEVPDQQEPVDLGVVSLLVGLAIEGQVFDPQGQPLARAEIRISGGDRFERMRALFSDEEAAATSDAEGRFRIEDLRQGEKLDVMVEREGYSGKTLNGVTVPTQEPLRVELEPAASVAGQVVDSRGEGIPGAFVSVQPESTDGFRRFGRGNSTQSDEDGHFRVPTAPTGRITVMSRADGYLEYRRSNLEVAPGGELADLKLEMQSGAEIEGVVRGPDGTPAVQAIVRLQEPGSRSFRSGFAFTDADGRFSMDGVGLGPRTIVAELQGFDSISRELTVEPGNNRIELTLGGGFEVSGRVVESSGALVGGADLWLQSTGPSFNAPRGQTAADGSFTITGVPPGTYRMRISSKGHALQMHQDPIVVSDAPISGLEIRLEAGATLSGRVIGVAFDDLSRLEIMAFGERGVQDGQVDFEGNYTISQLPPGQITVRAEIPGTGRQAVEQVTIPEGAAEARLDLDFEAGVALTGTVLRGEQPLAGASVAVDGRDVSHNGRASTDHRGTFHIENLRPGTYELIVSGEGGLNHTEEIRIDADREVRIRLQAAEISGIVRSTADMEALGDASISLEPLAGAQDQRGRRFDASARSDSHGYFSFGEVAEGAWKVRAVKDGYAPAEIDIQVLAGRSMDDLVLDLQPAAGMTLRVVDGAGTPVRRALVAVLGGDGRALTSGYYETTEGGQIRLTTVPAGEWDLLVGGDSLATRRLRARSPGDAGIVTLGLAGRLEVTVADLKETGSRAVLTLVDPEGRPFRQVGWRTVTSEWTVSQGRSNVGGLAAGQWGVEVRALDGRVWSGSVQVGPGQTAELKL